MNVGAIVRTFASRFLLGLLMAVIFIPFLIILMLPKRWLLDSKLFYKFTHFFYWIVLRLTFLPIRYVGVKNVPEEPAIFVANHQSSLDIPLLGVLVKGYPQLWLAKQELMDSPILRFVLPRVAVLVENTNPTKAMRSLVRILRLVHGQKRHVMIFPEGGRYTDGTVHKFFGGFVILAKKTGRPVVPVKIFGINKAYPPDSFLVHKHPITVVIGKPFVYKDGEDEAAFRNKVYQWFLDQTGASS